MDEKTMAMDEKISVFAFQEFCARLERTIKRLWILVIILTVLLVGTNCAWLLYESQFQCVETTEVSQDVDATDGENVVVSGTGDINYGESKADG